MPVHLEPRPQPALSIPESRQPGVADSLRVLVIANDPLTRAGLATLLAEQPETRVTGQIAASADLVGAMEVYQPDVVVWDVGWDPDTALEWITDLHDSIPPVATLLSDESHAAAAWMAGAKALLPRDTDAARLHGALVAAAKGLIVLDPELAVAAVMPRERTATPVVSELTPRELDVLRLMAEGMANKSISHRLGISEHTVKFFVNAILGKLGAQSRTEAVVRATRIGLIAL